MTNWQKFKIKEVDKVQGFEFIIFKLEKFKEYREEINGKPCQWWDDKKIACKKSYPLNTCQVGDYLEVDMDNDKIIEGLSKYSIDTEFYDTSVVRKFGSSAVVPSSSSTGMVIGSTTITRQQSLAVARELDAMVEQSGGTNEYTAGVEVRDEQGKPMKFFISSRRK